MADLETVHATIDHTGITGAGAAADILDLPTVETDDTLVLAPDGAGGVEFRAETGGGGGGGSELPIDAAATAAVGSGDLFGGTSLDGGWSDLQTTAVTSKDRSVDGYLILKNTGNTSGADRGIKRAFSPAGDFTVYAKYNWYSVYDSFQWAGIFVGASDPSDGASGHRLELHIYSAGGSGLNLKFTKFDAGSETSVFSTGISSLGEANVQGMQFPVWFRIKRVGTTLTAGISWDGVQFIDMASTTTISFAVATCGLYIGENTTSANIRAVASYIATTG